MRLLASSKPLPLGKLGLLPDVESEVDRLIHRPHGSFLCVGPTGSGKTTTLHSALKAINVVGTKIWTAEDPVFLRGITNPSPPEKAWFFQLLSKARFA